MMNDEWKYNLGVGYDPPPMEDDEPMDPAPDPPTRPGRPTRASRTGNENKTKGQTAGRFADINAFVDLALARLDRAAIATWILLWRDTKPDGIARTSQADLARRAGTTERTIRRALVALEREKLVVVIWRGGLNRGGSTYRVRPPDAVHRGHGCPVH